MKSWAPCLHGADRCRFYRKGAILNMKMIGMKKTLAAVLAAASVICPLGGTVSQTAVTSGNAIFALAANTAAVTVSASAGYLEGAYAEWQAVSGASGYNVYADGTKLDSMLIRQYKNCFRADAVGLKAGDHTLKIVPVIGGKEDSSKAGEVKVRYDIVNNWRLGRNDVHDYGFATFTIVGESTDVKVGQEIYVEGAKLVVVSADTAAYAGGLSAVNGTITVPEKIGDYTIVKIADYAFKKSTAKTIIINAPVTEIGSKAFKKASTKKVYFTQADKLTTVGKKAFKKANAKVYAVGADFSDAVKSDLKAAGAKKVTTGSVN